MKTSFLSAAFGALLFQELLDPSLALSIPWKRQTKCATGVHIIVARASTEAPGEGIIGAVSTGVKQKVVGSDSVAVDYPATLTNYQSSEGQGVAAMTKLIQSYAAACPDSKIVLMGYSQVSFSAI